MLNNKYLFFKENLNRCLAFRTNLDKTVFLNFFRLVLDSELSPPDYASFSSELLNQSRKVSLPTRPTKVHEYQTNKISSRSSSFSSYVSSDSYSSFANSDSD